MLFDACFLHLIDRLSLFAPPSAGLVLSLKDSLRLVRFDRGRLLVEPGHRQERVWFMVSGTVKELGEDPSGGAQRVSWLWFEDDFVFCYPGFFAHEPSVSRIEVVEECWMLELGYGDFMALRERFSEMHLLVERVRSHYEKLRVDHAAAMVGLSAKERYQRFFAAHKRVFNVARHKDIASFLGIRDDGFHRYQ